MPSKEVKLGFKSYRVSGHSEADPYYRSVGHGAESGFFRFLVKNLRRDSVALDVGANIGITSLLLSQVFDDGQVFAFEPGVANFDLLMRNLASNGVTNVRAINAAIADNVGAARFVEDSAYGGVIGGYRLDAAVAYEVKQTTIDAFTAETEVEQIDLIKIDVEGHERAVLAGAVETIERDNPAIYLEFNAWTLLAYGSQNPREFIDDLIARFDSVSVVDSATGELSRVDESNVIGFLHGLLMESGCVHDLLLVCDATRPRKVEAMKSGLAEHLLEVAESALVDRDAALVERDAALVERDAALADHREVLSSTSWRITAPLRLLARSIRGS